MKDYLLLREDAGDLLKEALKKMVPAGDGKFTFTGADGQTLAFSPHFLKNQERYGIYYRIFVRKVKRWISTSGLFPGDRPFWNARGK